MGFSSMTLKGNAVGSFIRDCRRAIEQLDSPPFYIRKSSQLIKIDGEYMPKELLGSPLYGSNKALKLAVLLEIYNITLACFEKNNGQVDLNNIIETVIHDRNQTKMDTNIREILTSPRDGIFQRFYSFICQKLGLHMPEIDHVEKLVSKYGLFQPPAAIPDGTPHYIPSHYQKAP